MCQDSLHDFLVALPKCEHHIHIEGSLEPELLFKLASFNGISLPADDPAFKSTETLKERYSQFTSLDDFLHYYFIGMSVMITAADFEALAYAYFEKVSTQNVKHAEIFFDPQAHTGRGVSYTDILDGLGAAQRRAFQDFGLSSELIVCMLRHLPVGSCHQTFLTALPDLKKGTIRGLGLSSTELNKPPHAYKVSYDLAREQGISHLTAHAGEEADVSYMVSAVHDLGVNRVDHGIKLMHDPQLLQEFIDKQILITMCPISNLELKCVEAIKDLPIRAYLDAGVPFSINSDDPAYFAGGTYIQDNYCAVQDAFRLSKHEWVTIVSTSIRLSWCDDARKQKLLDILNETKIEFGITSLVDTS